MMKNVLLNVFNELNYLVNNGNIRCMEKFLPHAQIYLRMLFIFVEIEAFITVFILMTIYTQISQRFVPELRFKPGKVASVRVMT